MRNYCGSGGNDLKKKFTETHNTRSSNDSGELKTVASLRR